MTRTITFMPRVWKITQAQSRADAASGQSVTADRLMGDLFIKRIRIIFFYAVALLVLTPCFCKPSQASPPRALVEKGAQIYNTKCVPCHTIGGGRKVGPDLQGVTQIRSKSWLKAFISNPDSMFNANDPVATGLLNEFKIKMPNMGLSADDVDSIIDYLETQTGAAPLAKTSPSAQAGAKEPASAADAGRGEKYFSGQIGFKNSGPPCMACHSAARIQFWGGGTLGPDLTGVYAQLDDGIVSVLVTVPFPTMKPIFDSHPLSEDEALDLAAFLKGISSEHPENYTVRIIASSFFAFVILMVIILFIWRNRLKSVRRAIVERAAREADN